MASAPKVTSESLFCVFEFFGVSGSAGALPGHNAKFPNSDLNFAVDFVWGGFSPPVLLSGKEKAHKHKQICGIVPGLGGCQKFVYVFFFGSFLMGEKKNT